MSGRTLSEPLRQLLAELPGTFPPERVDHIWLFAPRERGGRELGLVVLSLMEGAGGEGEQRQVVTWRYEATREKGAVRRQDSLAEQGWAPAERIPRLIEGVVARAGDEAEDPIAEAIGGDAERWSAFLAGLGIAAVDPTYRE